ncbi:MAG: hypothetical protein AAGF11_51970 [Myxococcota bacterium]
MSEFKEGTVTSSVHTQKCPPHDWVEKKRESPEETKAANQKQIKKLEARKAKKKSKEKRENIEREIQSAKFEIFALDSNMERLQIEASEVKYVCRICKAEVRPDILGKEQIAESQSIHPETYDGDSRKSKQAQKLVDVQRMLNEKNGTNHKPMAKVDKSKIVEEADDELIRQACERRNLELEIL